MNKPKTMAEAFQEIDKLVFKCEAKGLVPKYVYVGPEIFDLIGQVELLFINRTEDDPKYQEEPVLELEVIPCLDIYGPALGA